MNTIQKVNEKGQAIVMLVFGMIVLLGFTALAIDGGMVYSDRRHVQNAADAASLAGGGAVMSYMENYNVTYSNFDDCNSSGVLSARSQAEPAAIDRASSNGYSIDGDIGDNNGVDVTCSEGDPTKYFKDKYIDVTTMITRSTNTTFAHFVYSGPLANTVEAITRIRPRMPLALGHAIVALNDASCDGNQNGVVFGGSEIVHVNGGGIWSNGCMNCNGASFDVTVDNGEVAYGGNSDCSGGVSPHPTHYNETMPPEALGIVQPDCSGLTNRGSFHGSGTINPGIYTDIAVNSGDLVMNPGLYCIIDPSANNSNSVFTVNGNSLLAQGVTVYILKGGVTINGGMDPLLMEAPATLPNPSPAIPGLLFYVESDGADITLQGNSGSSFLGVVYAPGSDIIATGANGTSPTFHTQFIGWNVEISGNADVDINYTGEDLYAKPAALELSK